MIDGVWRIAALLVVIGLAGQPVTAKPEAEAILRTALERCAAVLDGQGDLEDEQIAVGDGQVSLLVETGAARQCKVIGAALSGDTASVSWAEGAEMVEDWIAGRDGVQQARLRGWGAPVKPVIGCGAISVIAQPLRVFGAEGPFANAPVAERPVEITLPAPRQLCEKYGAAPWKEKTHA